MNKYTAWGDIDSERPHHFQEGEILSSWYENIDGIPKLFWVIEAEDLNEASIIYHEKQGWEPYVPMEGAEYARFRGYCCECGWPSIYEIQIGREKKLFCSRHGNKKIKNCGLIHPSKKDTERC